MAIEEKWFRQMHNNWEKLRTDLYRGLMDIVYKGDTYLKKVSNIFSFPSSYTRSPKYRMQNY